VWTDLAKYRIEGFPNHFFSDLWAFGFWADHAHGHDGRGLDVRTISKRCTSSQSQVTSIERRNVLALIKTPITACVMLIKVSRINSVLLKMPRIATPAAPRAKSST
jgi:hypothetical protein